MAKVFISYARANEAAAATVAEALEDQGDTAWWDKNLPAHRRYSEVLEEELEGADAVIVLWSKDALESEWVRAEADVARNAQKLIQVSLDGTLPPIPFNQTHCVELKGLRRGKAHPDWARVDRSIRAISADEPAARGRPKPKAEAKFARPSVGNRRACHSGDRRRRLLRLPQLVQGGGGADHACSPSVHQRRPRRQGA